MVMITESFKKPVNISQSNELTEAAYYLPLQAKRVLWLCLMQCYPLKDDPDSVSPVFTVTVADYQKFFKVSVDTASTDVKKGVTALAKIPPAEDILYRSGMHIIDKYEITEGVAKFEITRPGHYVIIPEIYSRSDELTDYTLFFSRVYRTK